MLAVPAGDLPGQLDAESEAARVALDDAVEVILGAEAGVEVERKLVERDPGEALIAESAKADLVVVGSHGRTGFRAALLGSVSRHVVDHAKCPVVVVKQSTS
jgi:nucleotide-binding universal stress UspA family protein